ncbi:hypothetical protein [Selenomonas ruminantium]|uniref:Uncharacterized protein n=1 Tax=Selenomonas ruminantium TaxID=971 RepID=A0A1I0WKZ9_SELRU|nr:hypothetical protein [Selenomonas ruminantium]SFA88830.1 hypothetical protein SAMN05216587_10343 [Selenomonas ruminantium]
MLKIFTTIIMAMFYLGNICYCMNSKDISLSDDVGPGGFKAKYNSTIQIFNQRMKQQAIAGRFLLVKEIEDKTANGHNFLFVTKDDRGSILLSPSANGYIDTALLSVPFDNMNAGNDLYTLTLVTIFTLDLFEPGRWSITEDALNSINFNSTQRQFQSYILNFDKFTKKLPVETVCLTKMYTSPNNSLTIFMSKCLVSDY